MTFRRSVAALAANRGEPPPHIRAKPWSPFRRAGISGSRPGPEFSYFTRVRPTVFLASRPARMKPPKVVTIIRMHTLLTVLLTSITLACAAELPSKKWLNLAAVKTIAAAAEAEAHKRNVQVTI